MITLDASTFLVVLTTVTGLLGIFLIFLWVQDRQMKALAWWGAAYLLGGCAITFWAARPLLVPHLPAGTMYALLFASAGMIWGGARVFHGRRPFWPVVLAGAGVWLILAQWPWIADNAGRRVVVCSLIAVAYIVLAALETWRERRASVGWGGLAIPLLHGAVFVTPMLIDLPSGRSILASQWFAIFAIETMLYVVGTAFIVVVMTHERSVALHKAAAVTDPLTGLFNRRGFTEQAQRLIDTTVRRKQPVSVLMFDLDRFKSINDRYGHPAGDEALRLFGQTMRTNMRASDISARLGGEEFAAIVVGGEEIAFSIGERIRIAFEKAGIEIAGHPMAATVSVGAVCDDRAESAICDLLARADATLYRAKKSGRNRVLVSGRAENDADAPRVPVAAQAAPQRALPASAAGRPLEPVLAA
ncbi:MAG: diguanylate cyclase [Pseudorhodoplanes sp.]